MNGLGDLLLAASGHPIDHTANELTGELAGSRVRYQSAETEAAFAKARENRANASIAEDKAGVLPTLGDDIAAHASGSPADNAHNAALLIRAGGAPDGSFAGANNYNIGNRDTQIADPHTSVADMQRLLLATGKPLADVFAPLGADMHYNKLEGSEPVLNPNTAAKGANLAANTDLTIHRDQHPEDFRNAPLGSQPLDPADMQIVTKAQADGKLPPILPRAYATPALYHSLAVTVGQNKDFNASIFKQMQDTETRTNTLAEKGSLMNFNSAIGHLNDFDEAAVQLQNGNNQPFNAVANRLGVTLEGKSQATALNETSALLSNELESTYVNNGGTEKGREKIHAAFQDVNSPDQFQVATDTARSLLSERGLSLEQGYYSGRGTGNFRNRYLTPAARAVMAKYHPEAVTADISSSPATGNTGVVPGTEVHAQGSGGGASDSARTPGAIAPTVATSANPHPKGGNSASGPGGAVSGAVHITGNEDYAKLPKGAHYIPPDGVERIKP